MTYIAAGALVVIVLLVLVIYRMQLSHQIESRLAEVDHQRERAQMLENANQHFARMEDERRELLNRIQHPQFVPTPQITYEPAPPPKDLEEMGFVGQEVPDFYKVGFGDTEELSDVNP